MDGLSHTAICPCQWTNKTGRIFYYVLAAIYYTMSPWTERMSTDDPMWYFLPYHVTALQTIYGHIPVLPTTSDWMEVEADPFVQNNVTWNAEQEKWKGTNQVWHKVHKNIHGSDVVMKIIMLQMQKATSVICHEEIWKRCIKISAWITCFEDLTNGVAFVMTCKKSKITWIMMNAPQFSPMHTIFEAYSGFRRNYFKNVLNIVASETFVHLSIAWI